LKQQFSLDIFKDIKSDDFRPLSSQPSLGDYAAAQRQEALFCAIHNSFQDSDDLTFDGFVANSPESEAKLRRDLAGPTRASVPLY
jgi:hypothetical protein